MNMKNLIICNKNDFNEEKRIRLIRVVKDRMRKNDN